MARRTRRPADDGEDIYDALGREIRRARGERTQKWLAGAAGISDQTTLSDYELGRTPVRLDVLARIENALALGRGELLVRAGVVAPDMVPTDTPTGSAIRADPHLDDEGRDMVLGAYEFAREAAANRRFADGELPFGIRLLSDEEARRFEPDLDDPDEAAMWALRDGWPSGREVELLKRIAYMRQAKAYHRRVEAEAAPREAG